MGKRDSKKKRRLLAWALGLVALLAVFVGVNGHRIQMPSIHKFMDKEFAPGKQTRLSQVSGMRLWICLQRGNGPATPQSATIGFAEPAVLCAVVRRRGLYYSDCPRLAMDGKMVPAGLVRPLGQLPGLKKIWWLKVETARLHYKNSNETKGWWGKISMREWVDQVGRSGSIPVDVKPRGSKGVKWAGRHVGTMRFKVALEFEDYLLATPGKEAVDKGGKCPGVLRVSRLGGSGNPIVDHGLSLCNLPYIWGSACFAGNSVPTSHQAELYIGSDCADLVVAAWRLGGASLRAYSGVAPMVKRWRNSPGAVRPGGKGDIYFLDEHGRKIAIGPGGLKPGAAILWTYGSHQRKGHAAMLARDSGPDGRPNGCLDLYDWVLHTSWSSPQLVRLKNIMRARTPRLLLNPV